MNEEGYVLLINRTNIANETKIWFSGEIDRFEAAAEIAVQVED